MSGTLVEGKKKEKEKEEVGAPMEFNQRIAGVFAGIYVAVPVQKAKCQEDTPYVSVKQFASEVGKITVDGIWVLGDPKMGPMDKRKVESFVAANTAIIRKTYQNNQKFGKIGSD